MTDLFQEFRDIEKSFRCGVPLPDQSEFYHPDSGLEETDYIEAECLEPVLDYDDDDDKDDLLVLAEVPFIGSFEGEGRRAYQ